MKTALGFFVDVLDVFEVEDGNLRNQLRKKKAKKSKSTVEIDTEGKKLVLLKITVSKKAKLKQLNEWLENGDRVLIYEDDSIWEDLDIQYRIVFSRAY